MQQEVAGLSVGEEDPLNFKISCNETRCYEGDNVATKQTFIMEEELCSYQGTTTITNLASLHMEQNVVC